MLDGGALGVMDAVVRALFLAKDNNRWGCERRQEGYGVLVRSTRLSVPVMLALAMSARMFFQRSLWMGHASRTAIMAAAFCTAMSAVSFCSAQWLSRW